MSIDTDSIEAISGQLRSAETTRRPIRPLREQYPGLTPADAYAVQAAFMRLRQQQDGSRLVGHKVGATNPVIQALLGVHQPDWGQLLNDMVLPDGATIGLDRLIQPRVEVEIGFVLGADLAGPGVTAEQVRGATESVVATFEIIDSRIHGWDIAFVDTVADNGSSALVVVGDRHRSAAHLDLTTLGVYLERDGEIVATGCGAASLGDPTRAVAWLANALAQHAGDGLRAGQLVLSGALTTAPLVDRASTFTARFAELGTITCHFKESTSA